MSETVLLDIDALLFERVRRLAAAKGWGQQQTLIHLLENGLFACEAELGARFDDSDASALQAAIAALEKIDDDPGFAMIGRVEPAPVAAAASLPADAAAALSPDDWIAMHARDAARR